MICWKCGKDNQIQDVFRTTDCSFCSADLHSCKQCKFYSKGLHNDCKESSADFISDKEKANFCDYFSVNLNLTGSNNNKSIDAKNAFNALFGD